MNAYQFLIKDAQTTPRQTNQYEKQKFGLEFDKIIFDLANSFASMGADKKTSQKFAKLAFEPLKQAQEQIDVANYDQNKLLQTVKDKVCPLLIKNALINISNMGPSYTNKNNFLLQTEQDLHTLNKTDYPSSLQEALNRFILTYQLNMSQIPQKLAKNNAQMKENQEAIKFYNKSIDKTYAQAQKIEKSTKKVRQEHRQLSAECNQHKANLQVKKFDLVTTKIEKTKLNEKLKQTQNKEIEKQIKRLDQVIERLTSTVETMEQKQNDLETRLGAVQQIVADADARFNQKMKHISTLSQEAQVFAEQYRSLKAENQNLLQWARDNKPQYIQATTLLEKIESKNHNYSL